jgi:hypothetical protein
LDITKDRPIETQARQVGQPHDGRKQMLKIGSPSDGKSSSWRRRSRLTQQSLICAAKFPNDIAASRDQLQNAPDLIILRSSVAKATTIN